MEEQNIDNIIESIEIFINNQKKSKNEISFALRKKALILSKYLKKIANSNAYERIKV